ncbi:uncharacterized protein E0L32_008069 [Thyridium curvatum]|uniref:Myocyte-specific enhancer factor 2d n=1 Tax=Thyridium curvatum TaxID=1093900 RepID=A0A507AMG6_9PEZI|nr:uncharacterized protein E0L32_008069 [Thyridium curvatum]TPX11032.1 hypothetical protein E0L32_008069 [Thyridium curvatum]
MASLPDIPGYYYEEQNWKDEEKKKYFKIEKSHTAPSSAAWSSSNVKRRKHDDAQAAAAIKKLRIQAARVKRARVLQEPLTGGFLNRMFSATDPYEVSYVAFAQGLRDKGRLNYPDEPASADDVEPNLNCLYVNGSDEKTGLGVAYVAEWNDRTILGYYMARDKNDRLVDFPHHRYRIPRGSLGFYSPRREMVNLPSISDIKCHEPSRSIIVTSSGPAWGDVSIQMFSPPLSEPGDEERPYWLLGEADSMQSLSLFGRRKSHCIYSCTPAPAASDMLCALATGSGVVQFLPHRPYSLTRIPCDIVAQPHGHHDEDDDWVARMGAMGGEMFSVDFARGNHNVLFAGGRSRGIHMADLREAPTAWARPVACGPVAHVRSVNEHQVVVAGINDHLALYDLRFTGRDSRFRSQGWGSSSSSSAAARGKKGATKTTTTTTKPLLTFPGYRNQAHLLQIGFDVDADHGLAAAAHDDGRIALYSLRTGRQLRSPDVDATRSSGVVKALTLATMPRDRNPSLFAGIGQGVQAYSFASPPDEWEG